MRRLRDWIGDHFMGGFERRPGETVSEMGRAQVELMAARRQREETQRRLSAVQAAVDVRTRRAEDGR